MRYRATAFGLGTLLLAGALFGFSGSRPLSGLDIFELEYASAPRISPDGSRVVYVRNSFDIMKDRRTTALWIVGSDRTGHRPLTEAASGVSSPRWSPDGERLAYVARTDDGSQIFLRWMDTGQTARLTHLTESPRSLRWSPDGTRLSFSMLVRDTPDRLVSPPPKPAGAEWAEHPRFITRLKHEADGLGPLPPGFNHIFVLPVEGGTPRQITSGSFHHNGGGGWTPDGASLIFSANRNPDWEHEFVNSEIYSVSLADGSVEALTNRDGPDRSPAVSPDGRHIAYIGYDDKVQTYQVTHLYVANSDGTGRRSLLDSLDRSVANPVWAADGSGLYLQWDHHGNTKLGFVSLGGELRTLTGDLGGTSVGRPYGGGSFSVSTGGRFAYTRTRPEHPAEVWVGGGESATRPVTGLNLDVLPHRQLGAVEEVWWESSFDGWQVQGWVVTPPDFDPSRKYPLLLEIHGGPIASYGDRFSGEVQLYAAAGYVVLYANPRGSTGYGEEFGNLLYHNYPGQDYDDLMSGVDAVIARGSIDERNLFVTGGSAGGIMSAWIVGKTDRFRAAVISKPVINWYSKVLVADNYYAYHEYRYPGSPWENPEDYMKFSPISLVGNVTTPSMLMGGTADLRTPLSEARQFYHALKLRGIDTALVEIPGASHNIGARPSQLITKVAHALAWFEKYRVK